MLFIPSFFGIFLISYHFYLATEYLVKEEEPDNFINNYFAILDTKWNYPFLIMLAVWSTIYIESWKRKQNTVKHIWASEERGKEIKKSERRDQRGATYFVEKVSGKKTLSVLNETPGKNLAKSMGIILFAMAVAWCIWYLCMK